MRTAACRCGRRRSRPYVGAPCVKPRAFRIVSADNAPGNQVLRAVSMTRVLAYRMPGSDGLEVVRRVRAKGLLVPFIMLTGFRDEQMLSSDESRRC